MPISPDYDAANAFRYSDPDLAAPAPDGQFEDDEYNPYADFSTDPFADSTSNINSKMPTIPVDDNVNTLQQETTTTSPTRPRPPRSAYSPYSAFEGKPVRTSVSVSTPVAERFSSASSVSVSSTAAPAPVPAVPVKDETQTKEKDKSARRRSTLQFEIGGTGNGNGRPGSKDSDETTSTNTSSSIASRVSTSAADAPVQTNNANAPARPSALPMPINTADSASDLVPPRPRFLAEHASNDRGSWSSQDSVLYGGASTSDGERTDTANEDSDVAPIAARRPNAARKVSGGAAAAAAGAGAGARYRPAYPPAAPSRRWSNGNGAGNGAGGRRSSFGENRSGPPSAMRDVQGPGQGQLQHQSQQQHSPTEIDPAVGYSAGIGYGQGYSYNYGDRAPSPNPHLRSGSPPVPLSPGSVGGGDPLSPLSYSNVGPGAAMGVYNAVPTTPGTAVGGFRQPGAAPPSAFRGAGAGAGARSSMSMDGLPPPSAGTSNEGAGGYYDAPESSQGHGSVGSSHQGLHNAAMVGVGMGMGMGMGAAARPHNAFMAQSAIARSAGSSAVDLVPYAARINGTGGRRESVDGSVSRRLFLFSLSTLTYGHGALCFERNETNIN